MIIVIYVLYLLLNAGSLIGMSIVMLAITQIFLSHLLVASKVKTGLSLPHFEKPSYNCGE